MSELQFIQDTRRDLHKIPEVGFEEFKTKQYIIDVLKQTKAKVYSDFYQTAVIAYFEFVPGGETIAFRSDMDALSINEVSTHDYVSQHSGKMHACGHDGHMTMLLAIAKRLDQLALDKVNVALIFQPAEEGPGGAEDLIKTQVFKSLNISRVYGYHVYPGLKKGLVGTTKGAHMAATSEVRIKFKGQAAHGAEPHKGKDAILAASEFVVSVQSVISRKITPMQPAVVTIGKFEAGERLNIIAPSAYLEGTMRSYDDETHQTIQNEVLKTAENVAAAHGVEVIVDFKDMYPALVNDKELAEEALETFEEVIEIEPVMLAEDFSYFGKVVPSLFMFLGINTGDKGYLPLHNDAFDFDEHALLPGVDLYEKLIKLIDSKA